MKFLTLKFIPIFVLLLTAFLSLPSLLNSTIKKVEAYAQDTKRADVTPKPKRPKPQHPTGVPAPINDNCANAIAVNTCPFTDTQDTSGATDEVNEPQSTCTVQSNSVWYTYTTAANTAVITVSTCNSSVDTAIMVWQVPTATPCNFASFIAVGCNDDFCGDGFQSTVQFTANPNTTYKIQVGGFDGETGSVTTNISCQILQCAPVVINGTLGTGDPSFPGTQTHGNQLGRLNRNGISSTCAAPKTCLLFTPTGDRAYDAYTIPNQSGVDTCVSVNLSAPADTICNIQSNVYLNTFDPSNICTGYLADPGLSTGVPPVATNFSFVIPAGQTLIVVVHTTNPGEIGCPYTLTVLGDLCVQFDYCVQQDSPRRLFQFSSMNGMYRYTDCSKGIIRNGVGTVSTAFCKITGSGSGADSSASVLINPCTKKGDATINISTGTPPFATTQIIKINDTDITNNICKCP
jgi:hypothetical protein